MKTMKPTARDIAPGDVYGYRTITVVVVGALPEVGGYLVLGCRPGCRPNTLPILALAEELVA